MIFTFPHLGNTYIIAKSFLDDFGAEYVVPPFNSDRTLEIGLKYCAEAHCIPFKLFVGNMVQAHEMGADTMLITGGCGPCRLGYFGEMLKKQARDIGINMELITLEVPDQGLKELASRIRKVSGTSNVLNIARVINAAKNIAVKLDNLEQLAREKRAVQSVKGSVDKIYGGFQKDILNIKGSANMERFIKETEDRLKQINVNTDAKPLRVGIVGEIFTTIEPYANFRVEKMLGEMGVLVDRPVTVSGWIIDEMIKKRLPLLKDKKHEEAAAEYLPRMIGGHAQYTVGNSVLNAISGYDGVIHLYPLGCMPEIVSQAILPKIEEDYGIPIMTVIRDEMTGEAGFATRVEAFIDLLKKRRDEHLNEQSKMLYGN
ncbi:MAG TPA: 2-hydroxyacyl-CoA dehydratase [Ruminiclostridium sp.]|nr:2-hydroxyacyl-CoA dehydratase [Ruminiclostridium sp.]